MNLNVGRNSVVRGVIDIGLEAYDGCAREMMVNTGRLRRKAVYFTVCSISLTAWPMVARKSSSCEGFSIYRAP